MSLIANIKLGIAYSKEWPDDKILGSIFPEVRVKATLKLGSYLFPPFIVFILVWTFIQGGGLKGVDFIFTLKSNWPVALACMIFIALIPLQGYLWFAKRAKTLLDKRQKSFYVALCVKLSKQDAPNPTMYDLIKIINVALKTLDRNDFLKSL